MRIDSYTTKTRNAFAFNDTFFHILLFKFYPTQYQKKFIFSDEDINESNLNMFYISHIIDANLIFVLS